MTQETPQGEKPNQRSFFELDRGEKEAYFAQATRKAIAQIHEAGFPTVHGDEHGIYELYPDGRKVYVDDYDEEDLA
ncbi:MAG: hypothetical protein ABSD38_31550 [Syntrophorhabdales bacterium]|jgi:hypothetical protein